MKVMLTGGAGFIGLHLARALLEAGYDVDIVDNFYRGVRDRDLESLASHPKLRVIGADLLDPVDVGNLDRDYRVIVHLAAVLGVVKVMQEPYEVLVSNAQLLANMIACGREQANLERFVFASTSEIYAGTQRYFGLRVPTAEETPLAVSEPTHPRTPYMLSKIYGEVMCHHSRLPYTIVRPHNIYGPRMGMSHVIPELFRRAWRLPVGGRLRVYSVDHRRAFCYVDDAVRMLIRIVESPSCADQTLNLGRESPELSIGELAQCVREVMGRNDLEIEPQPETPGSPPRRAPDMGRAIRLTGCLPEVDIETGLGRTYQWYRREIFEGHGLGAD